MSYLPRNILHLQELPALEGIPPVFRLSGYQNGKRVRIQSKDAAKLCEIKGQLEVETAMRLAAENDREILHKSRLTRQEIRAAEAVYTQMGDNRSPEFLKECVDYAMRHLAGIEEVTCASALARWSSSQEAEGILKRTKESNRTSTMAFLKASGATTMREITNEMIRDWVYDKNLKPFSQAGRALRLRAWLNFCVKEKILRESPMSVDIAALQDRGLRARGRPMILLPEECHRLLECARSYESGVLVPYVILSTWCFMRHAEVLRTSGRDFHVSVARDGSTKVTVEVRALKVGTVAYRSFDVPKNVAALLAQSISGIQENDTIYFARARWDNLREIAGLISRSPAPKRGAKRKIVNSRWQENILRHTGISYFYKNCGDMKETTRIAGNGAETAFAHYLNLPRGDDAELFFRPVDSASVTGTDSIGVA